MDKFASFIKENQLIMGISWIGIVEIGNIFIQEVTGGNVTYLQMILVAFAALAIYLGFVFILSNIDSNNKLKWISSISDQFVHMQIFLDNNKLIIEILEGEFENLQKLAMVRGFEIEKIAEHNELIKVLVK